MLAKVSTAATLIVGPILDSTGAEYTGAVIGDLSLSKNGGTLTALASAATLTHIANGQYTLVLTTGNTDTIGRAQITCGKSTYQMPPVNLDVLPAASYDILVTNGTLASTTNITAAAGITLADGAITAAKIAADAITAAKIADGAIDTATFASGTTIPRVTLADTLTTYTGNTPQTGDSFARIGATGSGLTSLAPSSTALSTATWTAARAGYLDNLNVGGAVASQADVQAINQSASKHILIQTVSQYERPESGTTTYTVELRTFSASTGAAVNADSTPTISPVGAVSGDLSANLGAVSNPATGVYRATYSVTSGATQEQIRFDGSATISSSTFTISCYSQVVDLVSATWTSTDATHLTAIFNKLPSNNIADETLVLAGIANVQSDTDDIQNKIGAPAGASMSADIAAVKTDTGTLVTRITSTLFSGITSLAQWLGLLAGKQSGNSTARTEVRATGAGSGAYNETTDSQEAIRDRGDAAWTTGTGTSTLTQADVRTAVGLANADLDTQLATIAGYIDTEAAATLAAAVAIKAKTDQLTFTTPLHVDATATVDTSTIVSDIVAALSGQDITVTSPVSTDGETVSIVQGDDYYQADSRQLAFTSSGWSIGASDVVTLYVRDGNTTVLSVVGVRTSATAVYFELTADQTEDLIGTYRFGVVQTKSNSHVQTLLIEGQFEVTGRADP